MKTDPVRKMARLRERSVVTGTGCLEWQGSRMPNGYGRTYFRGRGEYVHRIAYLLTRGDIRAGLSIDHLCRNRACMNVDHMELVTLRENTLRNESPSMRLYRAGVCGRGHSMTPENVYVRERLGKKPYRRCRECRREYERTHDFRLREREPRQLEMAGAAS